MDIFTGDQIHDIAAGLETGNLPIKYAYMTNTGGSAWMEVEDHRNNSGSTFLDSALFIDSIETYLNDMGKPDSIILIDIGGGVGITSKPVIESLQQKSIHVDYHTIDISKDMIEKNRSFLSSIIDIEGHLLDIDEGGLRAKIRSIKIQNPTTPILVTIFGSTIGNFPEARAILRQIAGVLTTEDRIIIGTQIHLSGQESQILKIYQNDEGAHQIISATIKSLNLNLEGDYQFTWNSQENMIEGGITLNRETEIQLGGRLLQFSNHEYIRLMESRKHTINSIIELAGNMRVASTKSDIKGKFIQAMFAPYRM